MARRSNAVGAFDLSPVQQWFVDRAERETGLLRAGRDGPWGENDPDWRQFGHELAARLYTRDKLTPHQNPNPRLGALHEQLSALSEWRALQGALQQRDDPVEVGNAAATIMQGIAALAERGTSRRVDLSGFEDTQLGGAMVDACREATQRSLDEGERMAGIGWGTDAAEPGHNADQRRALLRRMDRSPVLKDVLRLAGRMRFAARACISRKPRRGVGAVYGIERGSDLSRLLPIEHAFLTSDDDALELLGLARFTQRLTMQYRMAARQPEQSGPMVVLLDVSGSMEGESEVWAKAVFIGLLELAQEQKRGVYFIAFNREVVRQVHFASGEKDYAKLIDAISVACGGGTSFYAPVTCGLRRIENDSSMRDADMIIITDGEADVNGLVERIDACSVGVRCFGVAIGASTTSLDVFCAKTWSLVDLTVEAAADLFDAVL